MVLRPAAPIQASELLANFASLGLRHVEIAWSAQPDWVKQCQHLCQRFPSLLIGAASVTCNSGLAAAVQAGLSYVVSPVLDQHLWREACSVGLTLIPGVMTPSEVHQARGMGCKLVKLFPAQRLGRHYWHALRAPLQSPLPFCIAAGGLKPIDVKPWLEAGVDAVTLGSSIQSRADAADALAALTHQRLH